MTIFIALLILLSYILIATSTLSKVNKAAVAMFAGTLGWVLYVSFGSDFVMEQHLTDYMDYLSGTTANSVAVKEYISSNIFIKYVGKASELVLYLLATMTIVEILNNNGCFDFIQKWIRTKNTAILLWAMAATTYFISCQLDNLTTTTMMLVIMHQLLANRKQRAIFGTVIVLSANVGGAMTVIGDANGLLLWNIGAVTPSRFTAWMALPCAVAWIIPTLLMQRKLPVRVELERVAMPYRGDDTNLAGWQRIVMLLFGIGGLWFIPTFHNITKLSPFVGALCVLSLLWIVNEAFNRKLMQADQMAQRRIPRALQYGVLQQILFVMGVMLMTGVLVETGASLWLGKLCYTQLGDAWTFGIAPMITGIVSIVLDSFATASAFFSMYDIASVPEMEQNGEYWILIAYAAGMGGTILGIGSMSGLALFRSENISLGWYLKNVTPKVLLGALLGLGVLIAEVMYF